jgi:hypothetical protein
MAVRGLQTAGPRAQNSSMSRKTALWIFAAVLIACLFVACFYFVDKPGRRTYQAYVALHGQEPFGPFAGAWSDSPDAVVLYRSGHGGVICYDSFSSKELHNALLPKDGKHVTVVYDTFSDFGHVRAYNVHSIDGIVLANGYHVLRPDFAGSAGVAGRPGSDTGSRDACW